MRRPWIQALEDRLRKRPPQTLRRFASGLAALALAFGLLSCEHRPTRSAELEALVIDYIEAFTEFHPARAASLGWHEHDGKLSPRNPEDINARAKQMQRFLTRAENLKKSIDHPEDQFDRDILDWLLQMELFHSQVLRRYERDPLIYAFSLDLSGLLLRLVPAWSDRAEAIVSRLERFPAFLAEARKNLVNPPRPVTETAIRSFRNLAPFLQNDLPPEMKNLAPELQARLEAALPKAVSAVEEMALWLEKEILPKAENDYALGSETYLEMLRTQERFAYSMEELLAMGREELARLQKLYKKTAAEIDPNKTPQEVTRLISEDHLSRDELVPFTASELDALKRQVVEHDLVSIPEGAGAIVQASPTFSRWNTAYIMTPGPFDPPSVQAIYFISPGEVDLTPKQVEAWLRSNNQYLVRNISVHEVYPGHYVNSLYIRNAATLIRKMEWSYAFGEGWAHYTEELFAENIYATQFPRYRLAQIQDALLRACRYMTSIGLHTQGWSIEQGTKFFMENAYVEEVLARQQTIRGTFDPGYLLYTLGKLYIKQMREDYRKKMGENFTLKDFHDALLQYGNPPLPMVRARLLGSSFGNAN